jgi:two-component system sensor histidine kinase PilS (NtrC family)
MIEERHPRRLKTLIAFRVVFVTLLLGSFFYFQIGQGIFPYPFSVIYLIIFMYSASIVYLLLLGRVPNTTLGYTQMVIDTLAAIALIFMTGGIESWFSWILLMVVFLSAVIVSRRAAYITATIASLLYGLIINWQFYGVIPLPYQSMLEEKDFVYKAFSHIGGLYLIAYLSGQLRARIEKSREDLEDLSRFNRDVIESSPSGIVTTDLSGRILLFNRSAEAIMESNRETAGRMMITELFPFLDTSVPESRIEGCVEISGKNKDVGLTASRLVDSMGKQSGYMYTFQDLTELKRLSREIKQKESLAAIGELSAKIAHEIRNPLASLKSSMEMLKEGSMSHEQKTRLMDIALTETDRLNHTITDFLKFSKPAPINPVKFDLPEVLGDVLDLLRNRDRSASLEFVHDFKGPLRVTADRDKLKDVFWNLGTNAVEAMPDGGTLKVRVYQDSNNVIIIFEDTGLGVSESDIEKVFFPFYTTKPNGTGLGLSAAYRTMEDHGGSINIANRPEGGAALTLTLPKG